MPFFAKDKKGEWKLLKGEIPLYSRNGKKEKKLIAVLAPFDEDGLAMHVEVVEPGSLAIVYGRDFEKVLFGEAIVRQSDFFLQNRITKKIILVIYVKKKDKGQRQNSFLRAKKF